MKREGEEEGREILIASASEKSWPDRWNFRLANRSFKCTAPSFCACALSSLATAARVEWRHVSCVKEACMRNITYITDATTEY